MVFKCEKPVLYRKLKLKTGLLIFYFELKLGFAPSSCGGKDDEEEAAVPSRQSSGLQETLAICRGCPRRQNFQLSCNASAAAAAAQGHHRDGCRQM